MKGGGETDLLSNNSFDVPLPLVWSNAIGPAVCLANMRGWTFSILPLTFSCRVVEINNKGSS